MKTENAVLMRMARESLTGKWGLAIGTYLLYMFISCVLQIIPILGIIASLIISGPFALGLTYFTLSLSRNQDARLEQIFQGFNNFGTALGAGHVVLGSTAHRGDRIRWSGELGPGHGELVEWHRRRGVE